LIDLLLRSPASTISIFCWAVNVGCLRCSLDIISFG